jgi:YHS domain-containing protein
MNPSRRSVLVMLLGSAALAGCYAGPQKMGKIGAGGGDCTPCEAGGAQASLEKVEEVNEVCMVNDQFIGNDQIEVEVNGKTYYGCCQACKNRLMTMAETRVSKDPLTGETVDKADAVIAKDAKGKVVYFASDDNFDAYIEKMSQKPDDKADDKDDDQAAKAGAKADDKAAAKPVAKTDDKAVAKTDDKAVAKTVAATTKP